MEGRLLARAAWALTCGQGPRSLASTACTAASTTFSRNLHVEAAAAAYAAAGAAASPQQRPAGLGQALPHLARTGCIYLDYNATTPIFPEVSAAMAPFLFEHFGNPSSGHTYGKVCKAALDTAREQVAAMVHAHPSEVHFTSCGTESDNWAIYGAVAAWRARRGQQQQQAGGSAGSVVPHVVTTAVEHPAILVHLEHLRSQGLLTYTAVPVDGEGLVDPAAVAAAVTPATALVTVMHSNNEVGAVQPIAEIAAAVRQAYGRQGGDPAELLVHTDAAQSTGKVELDVGALGVDAMTVVGHKFGAPKGVAALYIRRGVSLPNYFYGGGQEGGRRAGTENVMQVVGLGAAAALVSAEGPRLRAHMGAMAQRLLAGVRAAVRPEEQENLLVNGPADPARRLPNTLSLSLRGLNSSLALQRLSSQLAASAGAACHSADGPTVSSVLKAMRVPLDFAAGTLRLSTGRHTTPEDVDAAVKLIVAEAWQQNVLS